VAAVEGWLRVVLDHQLDGLGPVPAGDAGRERQREVDAGGHPGAADDLAVVDDPLVGAGHRPEGAQGGQGLPVGGDVALVEQSGGGEHQRTPAHRHGPRGRAVHPHQPVA